MIRPISPVSINRTILILIFICSFQACSDHSANDQGRPGAGKTVTVSVKAITSDQGKTWGYEILVNRKTYIHQEFIPALEGNQPFQSKKDALKVGRAVLQKVKNRQSPTLTAEEVRKLLDL
jgi:hypothetical protein